MLPKSIHKQEFIFGLLFVIIIFGASLILLSPLVLPRGIPSYGDETYYFPFRLDTIMRFNVPSWIEGSGPSSNTLTIFMTLLLVVLGSLFGQESAVKIYIMLMAMLSGFLTYLAIRLLARRWHLIDGTRKLAIASYSGGLFYFLFFYNPSTLAAANTVAWNYSFFPLLLALFCLYLMDGKAVYLLAFSFTSILMSAQPFWIYLIAVAGFCWIAVLVVTTAISRHKIKTYTKRLAMLTFVAPLFNSYWLFPLATSYYLGATGFFQTYTSGALITFSGLRYLSFWNTFDVIMLGEHAYQFFWLHPQNYGPLSVVIPIMAAASILISRKNRYVLFMALTLLIGIFLTKGANDPLGEAYYFAAANLPSGIGALLRNPTKFISLVTFSYSFLIGLFITKVYQKLSLLKLSRPRIGTRAFRYPATVGLVILVLAPVTYGTLLDLQGYTWQRYRPTYVPEAYDNVNSWLSEQEGHFKVVWLGAGGYLWKDGYGLTGFPEVGSSRPSVSSNYVWPSPLNETHDIGKLLSILGVKYIILHSDSFDFPNEEAYGFLTQQQDLRLIQIFEMPSVALIRDALLKIDYKLPASVVDAGYQGHFWDGFNVRMAILPIGTEVILAKVWEDKMAEYFAYNQQSSNDFEGTIYFNLTVPLTFRGSGANLYLNYYDGGFKSISPVYHLGSLGFDGSTIGYEQDLGVGGYFNATIASQKVEPKTAEIYVFENTNAVAPLYVTSQLVNMEIRNSSNSTRYDQKSPAEWHVYTDSSSPFILVFTEPYDRLWRAYVNGREIASVELFGLVNGFNIEDTGQLDIRIYYKLQDYFNLGYLLSTITTTVVVAYVFYNHTKSRSYWKYIKKVLSRKKLAKEMQTDKN